MYFKLRCVTCKEDCSGVLATTEQELMNPEDPPCFQCGGESNGQDYAQCVECEAPIPNRLVDTCRAFHLKHRDHTLTTMPHDHVEELAKA
jgi:hypothetical protein